MIKLRVGKGEAFLTCQYKRVAHQEGLIPGVCLLEFRGIQQRADGGVRGQRHISSIVMAGVQGQYPSDLVFQQ